MSGIFCIQFVIVNDRSFILEHSLPVQDTKSLVHGNDTHYQYTLLSRLLQSLSCTYMAFVVFLVSNLSLLH
jgi:hypothetical protein